MKTKPNHPRSRNNRKMSKIVQLGQALLKKKSADLLLQLALRTR
jgi:hypothetical protein